MQDPATYYDTPDKKQKHPHFEHRTAKLNQKNNEFTQKKFQRVRHVSNKKVLLESLGRIGRCLNKCKPEDIPTEGLQKVCLILINNYVHDKHDPKIGPLNDGFLIGTNQHRLGFKVFYLYNCNCHQYPQFLQFFLKYTLDQLTVFYSGRDTIISGCHGIEFKDDTISCHEFDKIIADNYNGRCKVVFISDSCASGSVFNISSVAGRPSEIISISASKSTDPSSKEGRRSHGIITYYVCKILNDEPNITPKRLIERINPSIKRFDESFNCEITDPQLENQPIFS